jgi:hypothetical protein
MARRKTVAEAPAPEAPAEEEGGRKRGPGELAILHAKWIKSVYNVDITAEQLYLAQSTRNEFRQDPNSGYAEYKDEREKAAAAEEAAEPAPAPARRGRKAAAPAAEPEAAEEAPKPASRRRGAKAAAAAAPAEAPAEAAPARSRRRTPPF